MRQIGEADLVSSLGYKYCCQTEIRAFHLCGLTVHSCGKALVVGHGKQDQIVIFHLSCGVEAVSVRNEFRACRSRPLFTPLSELRVRHFFSIKFSVLRHQVTVFFRHFVRQDQVFYKHPVRDLAVFQLVVIVLSHVIVKYNSHGNIVFRLIDVVAIFRIDQAVSIDPALVSVAAVRIDQGILQVVSH